MAMKRDDPLAWHAELWNEAFKDSAKDMSKMIAGTTTTTTTGPASASTATGTGGLHPSSGLYAPMHSIPVSDLRSLKIYKLPHGGLRIVQKGRADSFVVTNEGLSHSDLDEPMLLATAVCIGTVHDLVYKLNLATQKKADDEELPF